MDVLDTIRLGFADISLAQIALVMVVTLFASVVGGVAGYGTGALTPLVLVPLIGAAVSPTWPCPKLKNALGSRLERPSTGSESGLGLLLVALLAACALMLRRRPA